MMMSEFIERTKFEPTTAEYAEIEAEYMGCDIDKDKFCKEWVKNGGIQRLSRIRARRIEELETQLATLQNQSDKRELELQIEVNNARRERDIEVNNARRERDQARFELENLKRDIKRILQ